MTLLHLLSRISERARPLLDETSNLLFVTRIEDAHVGARYLPRRYEEVEVRERLRFVKEVFKPIVEGL